MPIDVHVAIGATLPEQKFEWNPADVVRYHLALGAGAKPTEPRELTYVLERELRALPTFAMTSPVAFGVANSSFYQPQPPEIRHSGLELNLANLFQNHVELLSYRPFPTRGNVGAQSRIVDIVDMGRNAVLLQEAVLADADGPLCTINSGIHLRGEGGFGGKRSSPHEITRIAMPSTDPDIVLDIPTLPQQALLYQLCGDTNPLHSDPVYAAESGFSQPLLQGACTYGMVLKSIVDNVLGGLTDGFRRYSTRFTGVVFPGDTIQVQVWKRNTKIFFVASTTERPDLPVLTDGIIEIDE